MADVKWIKIVTDIFDDEKMQVIESMPEGERTVLTWLFLLTKSRISKSGKREYKPIKNIAYSDDMLCVMVYPHNKYDKRTIMHIDRLEAHGFIKRKNNKIIVYTPWFEDRRDSTDYRNWRSAVLARDDYTCQSCGSRKNIQVHHIESWHSCAEKRLDQNNGITLCRECHFIAHGGNWHG